MYNHSNHFGVQSHVKASSPDELALVNFARYAGYTFKGVDSAQNSFVEIEGQGVVQYKLPARSRVQQHEVCLLTHAVTVYDLIGRGCR